VQAVEPGARRGPPLPLLAPAAAAETAGEDRRRERLEVRLARQLCVQRFEAFRCSEQERRSVAPTSQGEGKLRAQPLEAGALQLVERPGFGSRQQLQSRFGRTGLVVGLRCGQLTPDALRRIGSQRGGSLEKRGCGGETAAFSGAVG
jgi:hypothetical protein